MTTKQEITTNIMIRCTSLNAADFKEAIDLGLVCAAFDQQVNLIFIDGGINNLITNQSAANLRDKNHVDILKGLEFYDIEHIFVEKESLENSRLQIDNLLPNVQFISVSEVLELNLNADNLVTF